MVEENKETAQKLAQKHWDWLQEILIGCGVYQSTVNICKLFYISAFLHGYKHAQRRRNEKGQFA